MGPLEIALIILIILLLFGARKLPDLAKGIGKSIKEFKKNVKDDEIEDDEDTNQKEIKP